MPNFRDNEDLGELGKKYLNELLYKFGLFCLQDFKTFDIDLSHAFLRVTIAELSTLIKQVRFFGLLIVTGVKVVIGNCLHEVHKILPDFSN